MVGMIDLNTIEEDETTPSCGSLSSPSSSSAASALSASGSGSSTSSVCLELWHACAGPLISLPKRGSVVVYFPQGHLEQLPDLPLAVYDLPSHVFCRVVDVKLHVSLCIILYVYVIYMLFLSMQLLWPNKVFLFDDAAWFHREIKGLHFW
jgi:hypothetical protein